MNEKTVLAWHKCPQRDCSGVGELTNGNELFDGAIIHWTCPLCFLRWTTKVVIS